MDPYLTLTLIVGGGAMFRSESGFRFWTNIPPGLSSHSAGPDSFPPLPELPFNSDSATPVVFVFILIIFYSVILGEISQIFYSCRSASKIIDTQLREKLARPDPALELSDSDPSITPTATRKQSMWREKPQLWFALHKNQWRLAEETDPTHSPVKLKPCTWRKKYKNHWNGCNTENTDDRTYQASDYRSLQPNAVLKSKSWQKFSRKNTAKKTKTQQAQAWDLPKVGAGKINVKSESKKLQVPSLSLFSLVLENSRKKRRKKGKKKRRV